ncbi:MAG: hypothetical protein LUH19_05070 [Lachnospiraceae bacterium]|nr:hypothetical protein [Lachnospiraceae bacterium]
MDKAEYRIRTDEIKDLIADGEYGEAAQIADEIDWRRVKSVKMLCMISDLYKINRRYEDARNILLIAYDKNPQSRTILYALCELSIRLQELVDAIEYYKAYVQVAPQDSGRFVLQYRLYQAQDVSLEERIGVLEELKKAEYTERWGYELACLYHRTGMAEKCVAECDELILWFGEGKYVTKAMELKMLYEPLSEAQQYKYDHREVRKSGTARKAAPQAHSAQAPRQEEAAAFRSGTQKPVQEKDEYEPQASEPEGDILSSPTTEITGLEDIEAAQQEPQDRETLSAQPESAAQQEAEEISVKTVDVENKYSTMNLQKELAASLKELLGEVKQQAEPALPEEAAAQEEILFEQETEPEAMAGVHGGIGFDTQEISDTAEKPAEEIVEIYREPVVLTPEERPGNAAPEASVEPVHILEIKHPGQEDSMVSMTRMEGDGQIGMILPEPEKEEQQITGQLSIEDILAEWDRKDQQAEEEHKAEIYERIKAQTGEIFAEFDAKKKEDILNELQFLADEQEEREQQDVFDDLEEEEVWVNEEQPASEEQEDTELYDQQEVPQEDAELYDEQEVPQEDAELYDQQEVPQEDAELYDQQEVPQEDAELYDEQDAQLLDEEEEAEEPDDEEASAAFSKQSSPKEDVPEKYRRYTHSDEGWQQIKSALENASLPVSNGNIVVEGDNFDYCFAFIKQLLFDLKENGMELSGKLARISAVNLNRKKTSQIMDTLEGGAMVIERISMLNADKVQDIEDALRAGERNMILILVDTPEAIREFRSRKPEFMEAFPVCVNMQGLSAKELVQYGSAYAYSEEYEIDEMALLALQTKIEEEEASDKVPMPEDVEKMVDAAIRHANRIGMRKFFSALSGSRYNEDDMIILKEQDFV